MYVDRKPQPESSHSPDDEDEKRTIFCANLSEKVTEEILYELFIQAGPVESVHIAKDKDGRQKTFAFVTYIHACSVPYALELFDGVKLYNQRLVLKPKQSNNAPKPFVSPSASRYQDTHSTAKSFVNSTASRFQDTDNVAKSFISPSASRFCIDSDARNRGDGKQFSDNSALRMGNFNVLNQRNDSNLNPKEMGMHNNPFKMDVFARLGEFIASQGVQDDNDDNPSRDKSISKRASRNNRGNNRNSPYKRPEATKGGDRGHSGRKRNSNRRRR